MNRFYLKMGGIALGVSLLGFKDKTEEILKGLFRLADGFIVEDTNGIHEYGKITIVASRKKRTPLGSARRQFLKNYFEEIVDNRKRRDSQKEMESFLKGLSLNAHDERFISHLDAIRQGASSRIVFLGDANVFFYYLDTKEGFLFVDAFGRSSSHMCAVLFMSLRFICSLPILDSGGVVLHGAGVENQEKGFIFLGRSRAGKTTLSSFFPRGSVFSDETIIIRKKGGSYVLFATPFGKFRDRFAEEEIRIHKTFCLVKDTKTYQEDIPKACLLTQLFNESLLISRYLSRFFLTKTINILYDFINTNHCYRLHFRKNREFLKFLV